MTPLPTPRLTAAQAERLALLVEELAEAQQAVGKILRHGYNGTHPDSGLPNRENLENELGDVKCAVTLLCNAQDLSLDAIDEAAQDKAERVGKYLHHQRLQP